MPHEPIPRSSINFGPFEANPTTQELKKQGTRLRLPRQSFLVLQILLEKAGKLVTRDELQKALWPSDTFVDFERGLNNAINRLREALGDSAEQPQWIETLPRRGYRFIGTIRPQDSEVVPESGVTRVSSPPEVVYENRGGDPSGGVKAEGRPSRRVVVGWILVGVACVVAAGAYFAKRSREQVVAAAPVPFTDYAGFEYCPAFSPDGSGVAFSWSGGEKKWAGDIYVRVVGSENLLRLTQHPSGMCATWSPDGTQIAFLRLDNEKSGLYVVSALGGQERRLQTFEAKEPSVGVSWSGDGKWIAYADAPADLSRAYRIRLVSPQTLEAKTIPHNESCMMEIQPAFAHADDRLAYACQLKTNDNEFGIFTVSAASGTPKLIIISRPIIGGDDFELDEIQVSNGSVRKLPFGARGSFPAISSRGDKLAYGVYSQHVDLWRKDLWHAQAAPEKVFLSTYDQMSGQYAPDGKHIAFVSPRGGTPEIWVSDTDGRNLMRMSDRQSANAGAPRWSSDGQKLAFDSRQAGKPEIFIVDVNEQLPRKLITNLAEVSTPSWSHDGKWIYFQSAPDEKIFRCPADGGNAELLSPEPASYPFESADRKTVSFFSAAHMTVRMVSLSRIGTAKEVEGMPQIDDRSHYMPAAGGIYFVPIDDIKAIRYFDFATKRVTQVSKQEGEHLNGLSVSPDGRWILYTQVSGENSDIMMVEHFR